MKTIAKRSIEAVLIIGLFVVTACGGGDDTGGTSDGGATDQSTESESVETGSDLELVDEAGENWGTLKGSVTVDGSPDPVTAPRDSKCGIEKGQKLNRIKVDEENGVLQNALVYVDGVKKAIKSELPPSSMTIDQEKCVFVPRWTYVLRKEGTVTVKNSDPELHNFRYQGSSDFGASGNENQAAGAAPIDVQMNGSEWVDFRCNVHPWMVGMMRVSEHHAVARTGDDGSFSFDVPAGSYTVVVHHPELDDPVKKDVEVPEGDSVEQTVSVSFD